MAPPRTDEDLLNLTAKLRAEVEALKLDTWSRSDLFLLNWIKYGDYNLQKAEAGLRKCLKWRQDQNIDKVLDETFPPEFLQEIPYTLPGFDKEGWPILICRFGSWELKQLLNTGANPEDLTRFLYKLTEELENQLKTAFLNKRTTTAHGKPLLEHGGMVIYDFSGLGVGHFTSIQCVKILTNFLRSAELYYPRYGYRYYVVNVTGVVPIVMKMAKTLFGSKNLAKMTVLGNDKREWVDELGKYIAIDKLPETFYAKH